MVHRGRGLAQDDFLLSFFPLRTGTAEYNAASEDLLSTMFPGLDSGLGISLTRDFTSATTHLVAVGGISLTRADISVAQGLANKPFGMGPHRWRTSPRA